MLNLNRIQRENDFFEVWGFERVKDKESAQLDISKIGALFNGQFFSIRLYHVDGLLVDYMGENQVIIPVTYEYRDENHPYEEKLLNCIMIPVHKYYALDDIGFGYNSKIFKANEKLIIIQNTLNDFFHTKEEAYNNLRYIQKILLKGVENDLFR